MRSTFNLASAAMAVAALLLGGTAPTTAQKAVFAHYMVATQDYQGDDSTGEQKIAAYEKEIQQAQAVGIDGFALNAGAWSNQDYYVRYSSEIFEAAYRLNSGFKLMFSADMCCGNSMADVEDMVRRFANNSRYKAVYYQRNGKYVLSTFAGDNQGASFWQSLKSDLTNGANPSTYNNTTALSTATGVSSSAPLPIFLLPAFFWGSETPTASSIQAGFDQYQSIIDGSFYWGIAGIPGQGTSPDQIPSSRSFASVVHGGGKQYMAPICFQFWGANANRYYEYSGYGGMRWMWLDAINVSHPDLVEIITWNDFIEGTYVSPIDDPNKYPNANYLNDTGIPLGTLGYFHSHSGATDFLKYYIQWYKTGVQPAINADQIFWAYRTQSKGTTASNNTPNIGTIYGPLADNVYVSANLTSAAQLKVNAGAGAQIFNLQAGYNEIAVEFVAADQKPTFELDRNGTPVLSATGADPIQSAPQYNDFYYSAGDVQASSAKPLAAALQINAGGGAVAPFAADSGASGGNSFSSGAAIDLSTAANPAPAAVYQSCRWAPSFNYTLGSLTPNMTYTVRLHFAELTWTTEGARIFNVAANGTTVLSSFDVFAAAGGQNRAVTRQFTASANGSGQIVLSFTNNGPDNPMVSGIEVLP